MVRLWAVVLGVLWLALSQEDAWLSTSAVVVPALLLCWLTLELSRNVRSHRK